MYCKGKSCKKQIFDDNYKCILIKQRNLSQTVLINVQVFVFQIIIRGRRGHDRSLVDCWVSVPRLLLGFYRKIYTYDTGNNLTNLSHQASSGNWQQTLTIHPNSNHV
jgi:hypothetical protein